MFESINIIKLYLHISVALEWQPSKNDPHTSFFLEGMKGKGNNLGRNGNGYPKCEHVKLCQRTFPEVEPTLRRKYQQNEFTAQTIQ